MDFGRHLLSFIGAGDLLRMGIINIDMNLNKNYKNMEKQHYMKRLEFTSLCQTTFDIKCPVAGQRISVWVFYFCSVFGEVDLL